jgi:hypothetical protein
MKQIISLFEIKIGRYKATPKIEHQTPFKTIYE